MPEFRRGTAPIQQAAERKGFRAFVPTLRWSEDREEKFILFLHPLDDVYTVELFEWIPVGKGTKSNGETYDINESFISRKDPQIGEDYDDLSDRLGAIPRTRSIGAAVELEPVMEEVQGRQRPKTFKVATETFTNKENQTVVQPKAGLVIQSPQNFWGWLTSFDDTQAPVNETPMQVIRRGKSADTGYDFMPFTGTEVDLSGVIEGFSTINFISDDADKIIDAMSKTSSDFEAAAVIGNAMLEKRIEELADGERYRELVEPIKEYNPRFASQKRQDKGSNSGTTAAPESSAPATAGDEDRMKRFEQLKEAVGK